MHCRPTQANEHITIDPARDDPLPVRDFGPQHVDEPDRLQALSTGNDFHVHEGSILLTREIHHTHALCLPAIHRAVFRAKSVVAAGSDWHTQR